MHTMKNPENAFIAGIACMDHEEQLHHFPTNLFQIEIIERERHLKIGKVLMPIQFFKNIIACNENMYEDISK